MAVDEKLAARIRKCLAGRRRLTEQQMFGGLCFMLRGHMLCGLGQPGFMFRVGKDRDAAALARRGASPMVLDGRRMRGFVWVDPDRCSGRELRSWIAMAESYIATLPARRTKK